MVSAAPRVKPELTLPATYNFILFVIFFWEAQFGLQFFFLNLNNFSAGAL
jgi:hypothetical protein